MSTLREIRESLVAVSRRYSRVAHEVEDVAHDIVLAQLRRGVPLEGDTFLQKAHGAARRHAAFLARSAGRRRAREMSSADAPGSSQGVRVDDATAGAPLSVLSPALRTTLFLLLQGLDKAELRLVLGITDAALRKRFQGLRQQSPLARPELLVPCRTPALSQLRGSQVKMLPRLAAARLADGRLARVLAASDPDGHGLIFAEVLTPGPRAATSRASHTNHRTHAKGTPCSTPRSRTSPSSSSSRT